MLLSKDAVAITGYSILLAFSLYKLSNTVYRPFDLFANLLLIVGLSTLVAYHGRLMMTRKTETDDDAQKKLRLVAHSSLVAFLVVTLSPLSAANFQLYDWFALAGHSTLFVSVLNNISQLFGVAMLMLYFVFATIQKIGKGGPEMMNFVGRGLLLMYFIVSFFQGVGLIA